MRFPNGMTSLKVVAALAIAGCVNAPSGPTLGDECMPKRYLGSFIGNAAGAAADSLAGCAYYAVATAAGIAEGGAYFDKFAMVLTNGAPSTARHTIGFFRRGGRLQPRTYTVGLPEQGGLWGQVLVAEGGRTFVLTSGTVTITATGSDISGSLNLVATELASTATITVTGEFTARCIDLNPHAPQNDGEVDETIPNPCNPPAAAAMYPPATMPAGKGS